MAFKKKIRGKESTFYYVDFWIGQAGDSRAIHVNKSTRSAHYSEACEIEQQWKADAEEQYFQNQSDAYNPDEILFSEAIQITIDEQWGDNRSCDRSVARMNTVCEMLGDPPISTLYGSAGYQTINALRKRLFGSNNGMGRKRGFDGVDNYMRNLKTLLKTVQRERELFDLTIPHIKLYNKTKERTRTLTEAEEIALFKLGDRKCPEYSALYKVLLDTGMRLKEGCTINYREHIFLKDRLIKLEGEIVKNGKPRAVPMTERVHKILKERRSGDRVFPFVPSTASRKFTELGNELGYHDDDEFITHMLRHTCATRLLASGEMELSLVQNWIGHLDAKTTQRYTHIQVSHIRHGAGVLDKIYAKMRDRKVFDEKYQSKSLKQHDILPKTLTERHLINGS